MRRLKAFGFDGPFQGGKHPYMVKGDLVLTLPNPHRNEISPDLLVRIIRQAGISREEWLGDS
nr:type II toxin-antitoxin system HicA family toxin [Methanoregula sp.]